MKNTTYIHLPDLVKERAERLVDVGLFGNMSELIREAVRQLVEGQKMSKEDIAIELYKKEKVSLGKAAAIAGIGYDEMLELLYLRGIQPKFGPQSRKEAIAEFERAKRLL
ncbi:hypothetical protein AUJ17_01590 [Candidatus Micrarchaeota archaeon CG1_02_47_40]|nr:MAG: hypothetical protein AUJ17_01590 [Candidatus Micrarchaeota archaeon CG1_02_47_40]